jgi:signal transduction histidine kinase
MSTRPPEPDDFNALSRRIDARVQDVGIGVPSVDVLQSAQAQRERSESQTRTFIAAIVLVTYSTSLAVIFGAWLYQSLREARMADSAPLVELVKTAVLPVVTLVLGYYLAKPRDGGGTRA